MRKHLIWLLGLAVALTGVGIASAVPNTQLINGEIKPSKLPKKPPAKAVSIFVDVSATNSGNPGQLPNVTTLAKVDFDKDIKLYQKGYPTCDPNQFNAATTTEKAKELCGDAQIGAGSAQALVPSAPGAPPIPVTAIVTAFNGAHKTLVLHTYNQLSGAITLVGQIGRAEGGSPPSGAGSGYGTTLTVPVPPLAGGSGLITEFNTKVKKTYHYRHKKRSIVSSTCKDKKVKYQARFTDDQGQTAVGTDVQKCKPKKKKHHHH
jgi:hypothetical protein